MKMAINRQNKLLQCAQRRVTHSKGGVIRLRRSGSTLPAKQVLQILRSLLDDGIDPDVAACIQSVEIVFQPGKRALDRDLLNGNHLASDLSHRASSKINSHGDVDTTAAKRR